MKSKPHVSNDTKGRILETALHLFNDLGLAKVTLRTIAKEMGISQGNLNYHFKKRDDILEALYLQLVAKMDESVASLQITNFDLKNSFEVSKTMMLRFYDYRFFMLDFVQIMRDNQNIRTHYRELSQLREMQFMAMLQMWVEIGLIRAEEFEGDYANLYLRMHIIGDFWASTAYIKGELTSEKLLKYCHASFQNIYPYLTQQGKEEFHNFLKTK
jgi:AcrR family transcriptional regulator